MFYPDEFQISFVNCRYNQVQKGHVKGTLDGEMLVIL